MEETGNFNTSEDGEGHFNDEGNHPGDPDNLLEAESSMASPPTVFYSIHRIRSLVIASIDDPYTYSQLTSPRVNRLIVRPLINRLWDPDDYSIVFCLMVNRLQFLKEQSTVAHQSVSSTRATLCELLATRILRKFREHHDEDSESSTLIILSKILVEGFDTFSGAPQDVEQSNRCYQFPIQEQGGNERKLTALELAILSTSKDLISSHGCQLVVDAIHQGRVVYSPISFVDILPDHYKRKPIALYNPFTAPLLDHRRLIVPRVRAMIELFHFIVLLGLYFSVMTHRDCNELHLYETAFIIYTMGWSLHGQASIIEHGWAIYSQNLWSALDLSFFLIFGFYVILRVYGLVTGTHETLGLNVLSVAAPILLTRIAFNLMPESILFIALHRILNEFLFLSLLTIWCFAGFFLALQWLVPRADDAATDPFHPQWWTIVKWLLWIWFGLDGTGLAEAPRFHDILGPALMIAFAFLGNTLFLTILVALLTNTFSRIVSDEMVEIQFRRAVLTFEGVKSDSIFAYPPPLNLGALVILLPLKAFVSPRTFHSINVALIRTINAPILLLIGRYERQRARRRPRPSSQSPSFISSLTKWHLAGFSPHGDVEAVFDCQPPDFRDEMSEVDGISDIAILDHDIISRSSREIRPPPSFWLSNRRSFNASQVSLAENNGVRQMADSVEQLISMTDDAHK